MKKTLLFFATFLFCFSLNAQLITIPDVNFKNALVTTNCVDLNNNGSGDADADTNNDGEIQLSEVSIITGLYINNQSISSLSGIENFSNLQRFDCSNNPLVTLNLNSLTNLVDLNCMNCQLTSLNLVGLFNLNNVSCPNNNITELDFSNTSLRTLHCLNNPNLAFINVKNGYFSPDFYQVQPFPMDLPSFQISSSAPLNYICHDEGEFGFMLIANQGLQNISHGSYCSNVPGGDYNSITGTIAFDCNATNQSMANTTININNGVNVGNTSTNATGNYTFYIGNGMQTITPSFENPSYFSVTPPNYNFTFTTTGNTQTANFCVAANGVHPDLKVTLFPITSARPGFDASYKIIVKNIGNQIQSGTVALNFDDAVLDYISSLPIYNSQSLNTLTWDFSNLTPLESRSYNVTLNVNAPTETPAVNSGDILNFTTTITTSQTDETPSNNTFTMNQTVVGSFDPNDKTCIEGTQIAIADIDKPLHYIIRFQNMGTAPAENIVVKDLLNAKLDWNSVQITGASHPFRSTLTQNNKLEFFFENINLPTSSVDEPASHGYIAFDVKPKNTVVLNDVITKLGGYLF